MIKNFFSFPVFIIALAIGLLFGYLKEPEHKVKNVYPTPDNINKVEYKDKADNCFKYTMNTVVCPSDKSKIETVPIQA